MSRALEYRAGSGRPVALAKFESFMPSRLASTFISVAKAASEPATFSARAIAASLPDCTIMPLSSTSTGTCLPTSTKVREPSARHARSLIVTGSSRRRRPAAICRNTTIAVINLVMLAGSARCSASCAASVRPLAWSMRMNWRAGTGPGSAGEAVAALWAVGVSSSKRALASAASMWRIGGAARFNEIVKRISGWCASRRRIVAAAGRSAHSGARRASGIPASRSCEVSRVACPASTTGPTRTR